MAQITLLKSTALAYLQGLINSAVNGEASARQSADDAIRIEIRDGRVFTISGGDTPSGLNIPSNYGINTLIQRHNTSNRYSIWRSVAAPVDGLETDELKLDANGGWWRLMLESLLLDEEAARIAADQAEAFARSQADATHEIDRHAALPGDDIVIVDALNGPALFTRQDGVTRGTFLQDDIKGGLSSDEVSGLQNGVLSPIAPGDGVIVVEDRNGRPLLFVDEEGLTSASLRMMMPTAPGDHIAGIVDDKTRKVLFGIDTRDGSIYPTTVLEEPTAPGDFIFPLIVDETGAIVLGLDIRDGSLYPAVAGGGDGGGNGSTVEFVDPDNNGDAWNAIKSTDANGEVIRYLSRQWRETWGYEKRGDVTLAQTPNPAVGIVAFGGGSSGVVRSIADDFPWHLVDETLIRPEDGQSASAQAAAFLEAEYDLRRGLQTVVALTQVVSSTVEADALPGSPFRAVLIDRITAARTALEGWGKEFFVDRISLSLLEGTPATSEAAADFHYAAVAEGLREEVSDASGQIAMPLVVVSQSAGTRTNGTSEVILAEGLLDWTHWGLGIVVAGPRYPYPLAAGSPAALTPDGAMQVSEIEALAVSEKLAGRDWYTPTLGAHATLAGSTITVPFTSMSNLVIRDPANHGFAVDGITNTATVSSVAVSGTNVLITMSEAPTGTLTVRYAWGETGDQGDGFTANRGSLSDSWSQASRMVSGATLYRYARSGRISVQ